MRFPLTHIEIETFLLIFFRVSAILLSIPIFGSRLIPFLVKAALCLFITWLVFLNYCIPKVTFSDNLLILVPSFIIEIVIGALIGFIIRMIIGGVEIAGEIVGFQMGFGIVNVIDPQSETQVNIIGNFKSTLAIIIFLTLNAHYGFLKGIVDSFSQVPLLSFSINPPLIQKITSLVGNIFIISLKIGAPVIVTLLVTQVVMGIISRLVPQMNIFMVSLPLKIGVGLIVISVSLPYFLYFLKGLFFNVYQDIMIILQTAGFR